MHNPDANNLNQNKKPEEDFPKATQYADEILEGKYTFESLNGQIPDSWIDAVKTEIEKRGFLVLPEDTKETTQEENISFEEISQEVHQAKESFTQETSVQIDKMTNIGIPVSSEMIEQAKMEVHFDQNISELKKDLEEDLSKLEHIELVNNKIKAELLSRVDTRYTKQDARDLHRSNIENKTGPDFYRIILDEYYRDLRTADYPRDGRFDIDIDDLTIEPNQLIRRVQNEDNWHYRMAQTSTSANKAYARISLNVTGNKELIGVLDQIAYRYGIYYKTPNHSDAWNERTDPVTIYINNPNLTPELLEQLKSEVVSKVNLYIRDNNGFGIYGDNISEGVEYGPENSLDDIQKVKQEAREISEDLYEAVNQYLMKDGKEKGSVGQIMTVKKIINMFLTSEDQGQLSREEDQSIPTEQVHNDEEDFEKNKNLSLEGIEHEHEFQEIYQNMVLNQFKKDFPSDFARMYEPHLDEEFNLVPKNKDDVATLASSSITNFKNTDIFEIKQKAFEAYLLKREQYNLDSIKDNFEEIYARFRSHTNTDTDKKMLEKLSDKILMHDLEFSSYYEGSMNANKDNEFEGRIDALGRFLNNKGYHLNGIF